MANTMANMQAVRETSQPLDEAARIKERLVKEVRRFDLVALLELLHQLGYQNDDIEYRSNQTLVRQGALVDSIHFAPPPGRRVILTVNLGWLGPQSALPSYFQSAIDHQDEDALTEFLGFFCHHLLEAGVTATFPERNPELFKDFSTSLRHLRSLLGVRSLSTIHWAFSFVFPELEVAVKRTILKRTVRTRGMVLGEWSLGDGAACGGIAEVPVNGVAVSLLCDEPVTGTFRPWALEANERLRQEVFPILATQGQFLHVLLVLRDQRSFMVLKEAQYLGYEPIYQEAGSPRPTSKIARTVVLWSGETPH